jgi:CheY-like chemotaxis protein
VALHEIFALSVEATRPDLERTGHRLDVRQPEDAIWIDADVDRIVQVLTNLLNNASRYSPAGARISLSAEVDDESVLMRVADTGVGLEAADLERIFEMFKQVGRPGAGGLGIGLALVKAIVELHRGTVEARSGGPGKGSEFRIRLPRAPAPVAAAPPVKAAAQPTGRTVVIADDNEDSTEMMRLLLEMDGHTVHVAMDGPSAVELIQRIGPQVAVVDIGMPGFDGYEVARRVRADGRAIYLIAVTGWGQDADRERAHASGFDVHLTKPADPEEIRRLLAAR